MPGKDNTKPIETIIDQDDEIDFQEEEQEELDPYKKYEQDEKGRFIIPLKYPIKHRNQTYENIALRSPNGGDLRITAASNKSDVEGGLILIERCGRISKEVVDKMRPSDIKKLMEVINFLSAE